MTLVVLQMLNREPSLETLHGLSDKAVKLIHAVILIQAVVPAFADAFSS